MPLMDLDLRVEGILPGDVGSFLREAERRVEQFQAASCVPAFVPSDFGGVYAVLRALAATGIPRGNLFCEWGSGFGVVTCLAAMLDLDAFGIEIEGELVDAARQLADDCELPAEFIQGSFIPAGGEVCLRAGDEFAWLTIDAGEAYDDLGLAPDDFDVIFAYPWPDEEWLTEALFERYAAGGAVLVTYHSGEDFRLRQKIDKRPGRRGRQRLGPARPNSLSPKGRRDDTIAL
jgi:hypothetical protein